MKSSAFLIMTHIKFSVMCMTLSTTSFWINMCETMYWEAMSTDEHQLFKMTLSFMTLSLRTERSLTSLWSSTLSFHFRKASDALNRCFKEMHQVFLKWLFTISRKYDLLSRNNDSDSQMSMKIRVKILIFRSLTLCCLPLIPDPILWATWAGGPEKASRRQTSSG